MKTMELKGVIYQLVYQQGGVYALFTIGNEPKKGYIYNSKLDKLTRWF